MAVEDHDYSFPLKDYLHYNTTLNDSDHRDFEINESRIIKKSNVKANESSFRLNYICIHKDILRNVNIIYCISNSISSNKLN